jgi:hypothetical protein
VLSVLVMMKPWSAEPRSMSVTASVTSSRSQVPILPAKKPDFSEEVRFLASVG